MVLAKPSYGMYPADAVPVPAAINDPRSNSPYRKKSTIGLPQSKLVRYMVSDYYGLVTEVDIGSAAPWLDELGWPRTP